MNDLIDPDSNAQGLRVQNHVIDNSTSYEFLVQKSHFADVKNLRKFLLFLYSTMQHFAYYILSKFDLYQLSLEISFSKYRNIIYILIFVIASLADTPLVLDQNERI